MGLERLIRRRNVAHDSGDNLVGGDAFGHGLVGQHQAMAQQPAPDGVAPGTVIQAWTPAWTLNGRLLKPAMVVVAEG